MPWRSGICMMDHWKKGLLGAFLLCPVILGLTGGCERRIVVKTVAVETDASEKETKSELITKTAAPEHRSDVSSGDVIETEDERTLNPGTSPSVQGDHPVEMRREMPEPLTEAACIYVHVIGQVCAPGVYALPEGARVFEAVEAAGSFAPDADREWCNLALPLADADRLKIYSLEETAKLTASGMTPEADHFGVVHGMGEAGSAFVQTGLGVQSGTGNLGRPDGSDNGIDATGTDSPNTAGTVNINTAGVEELMTLSGIGKKRAEDIIAYREMNGPFSSTEELMNVSGIGQGLFGKLSGQVMVS